MPTSILITGVSGFIGSHVASLAAAEGHSVVGLDVTAPSKQVRNSLASFQELSLSSGEPISLLSEFNPDWCIHCAGMASVPNSFELPVDDFAAGPLATIHLLNQIRRQTPQCRTVLLSSAAVYGNPKGLPISETCEVTPLSPYGWHKRLSEQVCGEFSQLFNLPTAIARIFSAYGPGLRKQVVWDLCEKFASRKEVFLQGKGTESRDFIYVSDIARGLLTIAEKGQMGGNLYNLAGGEEVPIRLVAEKVRAELNLEDVPFDFSGKLPPGTPSRWQADVTAMKALGFSPEVPFSTGIFEFVDWWKKERNYTPVESLSESLAH